MAVRTTGDAVKAILLDQYDLSGNPSLTAFILTANVLVDRIDDLAASCTTDSMLERVECFLAAHFYAHADQLVANKSTEGASGSFQGQTGMYFSSTQYGQSAMTLDCTGLLAQLEQQAKNGRQRAGAVWLGTRYRNDTSERSSDQ